MSATYTKVTLAAFIACVAMTFLVASPAQATFGEFAAAGEISVGGGEVDEGIAVDESTGDVYVYDSEGTIFKYDANGDPVDFSGLGTNEITGLGRHGSGETELAVDNSSGPAKGDLYMAIPDIEDESGEVAIFSPGGEPIGKLTKMAGRPWGEVCGVAVDGSGNVYVGLYPRTVGMYTPAGNPVNNGDYVGANVDFNEVCQVAADHDGRIYAGEWTPDREHSNVVRLEGIQANGTQVLFGNSNGTVAAANDSGDEVFVSDRGEIRQYNPTGGLLSAFGDGNVYYALAFNAKTGTLYTYDRLNHKKIEIWQGFVLPRVDTLGSSALTSTGDATLNGSIDPEGVTVESCFFQYGLTTSYGSVTSCAQAMPLTGVSALSVSVALTDLTLNHTYHYRLSTTDSRSEVNGADQTFSILVRPSVEDQQPSVSDVTRSTARLEGVVDPQEGETSYRFEYGPTEEYGNATPPLHTEDLVSGDVPFEQQVAGLIPGLTYHYRVVATNVAGTTYGADHTFMSGEPAPPSATTDATMEIEQNTATITGLVTTNGLPTSYGFEIATNTDYGPPTGLGYVGAGLSGAPVSLRLTGLQPGTTYHYRVTASNVDGTVYGADATFTTSVYSSTFAEPPAPLPFVTVPQMAFPAEVEAGAVKKAVKKTKPHKKAKSHKKRTRAKGKRRKK